VPVRLELATNLAHVVSSEADLKRLCLLLLKNWGRAATATGAGIGVRTATSEHSVQLRVEDSGPALAPDCLKQMFDPQVCCREGTNSLELAACKAIVRRLRGAIRCENGEKQGAAVVVELPLAADVSPT
jgi:C4-dicarboxylate-specific signal transduction histidine kinase